MSILSSYCHKSNYKRFQNPHLKRIKLYERGFGTNLSFFILKINFELKFTFRQDVPSHLKV
jgi:hypothetical protein